MIIFLYIFVGMVALAGAMFDTDVERVVTQTEAVQSVEIGLAELSPDGEAGGYAVPASGEGASSCSVAFTERAGIPDPTNPNITVTWNMAGWSMVRAYNVIRCDKSQGPVLACRQAALANPSNGNMIYGAPKGWVDYYSTGAPLVLNAKAQGLPEGEYDYRVGATFNSHTGGRRDIECSAVLRIGDPEPGPSVVLEVRNDTTESSWTGNNITIEPTHEISLRWDSTNATSCTGTNFTTGGAADGTQSTVTEPPPGTSRNYRVSCTGPGGTASDVLRVTTSGSDAVNIDATPPYVHKGEEATLEWDTGANAPATCSITGPGVTMSTLPSVTGTRTVTLNGESTYLLDCPSADDEVTVRVLPVFQET